MLVTDIKRKLKNGKEITGFYMDRWLKDNLDGIPSFIKKDWDCVGIVSGHGKVRIGKSTMGMQVSYYLAWRLAGGEITSDEKGKILKVILPKKKVHFNLHENVVFSAESLQETAARLYDKYGKNQVILYDEGRQGLDSARAMESINKGMEDFFQECGFMGHIIIICLPNFFKLHEDYAVARSLFLIDVFADKEYNRGFFNFYNDRRKESLYYFGKKRIGVTAKYSATKENFWGRFYGWMPFNKEEYETKKKEEIEKKRILRRERNLMLQRDIHIYLLNKHAKYTYQEIMQKMKEVADFTIAEKTLRNSVVRVSDIISKTKGYV
tara:strand:- start:458 stop:1426 length:969 start_codon:yes stop_codon:yes gene_type:complete